MSIFYSNDLKCKHYLDPSVALGLLAFHLVSCDGGSTVVLWGLPGDRDVVTILLLHLRLAWREWLVWQRERQNS